LINTGKGFANIEYTHFILRVLKWTAEINIRNGFHRFFIAWNNLKCFSIKPIVNNNTGGM